MKKYLAIMFTVFYFGFSSGMVYNVHYCLDQILVSSVSSSKTCDVCGTEDKKDCCKSEVKVLKTDVGPKANISFINDAPIGAVLPQEYFVNFITPILERNNFSIHINAPPETAELPLFISHCNFRI
ncbi:hypothetical protein FNJ88_04780 [Chryseobacterium sp. SNU WT5]|uniref:HYC_CC_PP family protein n=1 Tax=Chryseobacterium sp. SNU WT5 TaxID=2594269 RepID=UPI001180095E|nr:hypothetical protein [Chryseobacterium sp. SNU WT5]QDP84901.1 hypothetical protein FNJ88_04780 [Chryseobacterium sp. SNU WT5]